MHIRILKETPYRHGHQRPVMPGEIHAVTRIREKNSLQFKAYFFIVDGEERMVADRECKVIDEKEKCDECLRN